MYSCSTFQIGDSSILNRVVVNVCFRYGDWHQLLVMSPDCSSFSYYLAALNFAYLCFSSPVFIIRYIFYVLLMQKKYLLFYVIGNRKSFASSNCIKKMEEHTQYEKRDTIHLINGVCQTEIKAENIFKRVFKTLTFCFQFNSTYFLKI